MDEGKPPTLNYRPPHKRERDWMRIARGTMIGFGISVVLLLPVTFVFAGTYRGVVKMRAAIVAVCLPFACAGSAAVIADLTSKKQ